MTDIWFYHLEKVRLETVLPELLTKVLQRDWRAYVHCAQHDMLDALSQGLWGYSDTSFLAHSIEGEAFDKDQPIILGTCANAPNEPQVYLSVSPIDMPDIKAYSRVIILFEGDDETHLDWARAQWKRLKSDKFEMSYWQFGSQGRWEKKL